MKEKKNNAKFKDKCSEFKSHEDKTLFNISSCKCVLVLEIEKSRKQTNIFDRSKNFQKNGNWRS